MPQYLGAGYLPDNYDPSLEGEAVVRDISALNKEMIAAGVRIFMRPVPGKQQKVAAGAARWRTPHHRRAVP